MPNPIQSAAPFAALLLAASSATDAWAQGVPAEPTVAGVTVNATRPEVETSIDRRSYSLANDLSAQTGSVADVLRNIPSVQVDAQGNPSLLGQGNVTILVDGRPSSQFSGSSLGQALQAMAADRIDRIEVMTNPPAEYRADGAGGIINLITKRAKGAGRSGSARIRAGSHDRVSANANLGYNSDRVSVTGDVAFRRMPQSTVETRELSRSDPWTGPVVERQDLALSRWVSRYAQAHAALDYDLDSRTRLTGSVRYSSNHYDTFYTDRFVETDPLGNPGPALSRTGDEDEFIGRGEAALTWRRTLGDGHVLTLQADHQLYHNDYRRLDLFTPLLPAGSAPSSRSVVWNDASPRTILAVDYQRPVAGGGLKLGYDFEYAPKHTDQDTGEGAAGGPIVLDPSRHGRFSDTETDNEAYISFERGFGGLTALAGLRAKHLRLDLAQQELGLSVVHDYPRLYPNLRVAYALSEGRQLTASYSRRANVPYSQQLDPLPLSQSPLLLEAGNPDLRPEDTYSYELGYEDRRDGRLMIATLFYRETRDAFTSLSTELPDGVILQTTVNAGALRRAGVEWAVSGKLTPALSYSFSLDGYWIEIGASNLGLDQPRSSATGFGRANLNWQVTQKDLLQLNLVTTGKVLRPQGYSAATYSGNIGYRHIVNDRVSWMLVAEDPFKTLKYRSVETIDGLENRRLRRDASQYISLAIVWNFAGKPRDSSLDLGAGDNGR